MAYPGLCNKIDKLAKKKDYDEVGEWRQSISNHMYWCVASTPDGNGEVIQEKWKILAKTFMSMPRVTYILNVGMATCRETQLISFGFNQV